MEATNAVDNGRKLFKLVHRSGKKWIRVSEYISEADRTVITDQFWRLERLSPRRNPKGIHNGFSTVANVYTTTVAKWIAMSNQSS